MKLSNEEIRQAILRMDEQEDLAKDMLEQVRTLRKGEEPSQGQPPPRKAEIRGSKRHGAGGTCVSRNFPGLGFLLGQAARDVHGPCKVPGKGQAAQPLFPPQISFTLIHFVL